MFKKLFQLRANSKSKNFTVTTIESEEPFYVGDCGNIYETTNIKTCGLNLKEIIPRVIENLETEEHDEIPMTLSKVEITDSKGEKGELLIIKPFDSDMVKELDYFARSIRTNDKSAFIDPTSRKKGNLSAADNFRLRVTMIDIPNSIDLADIFDYLVKHPPFEFKIVFLNVDLTLYNRQTMKEKDQDEEFVLTITKNHETRLEDILQWTLSSDSPSNYPEKITVKVLMTFPKEEEQLPEYTKECEKLPMYTNQE